MNDLQITIDCGRTMWTMFKEDVTDEQREAFFAIYGGHFTFDESKSYMRTLQRDLGFAMDKEGDQLFFDTVIREAHEKWNNYLKARIAAETDIDVEVDSNPQYSGLDDVGKKEAKKDLLWQWEQHHSPTIYHAMLNEKFSTDTFIKNDGYKYTLRKPRLRDEKGNPTKWYNKEYDKIKNNTQAREFFEWYKGTLEELRNFMPTHVNEKLQGNYLPEVWQSLIELKSRKDLHVSDFMNEALKRVSVEAQNPDSFAEIDADGKPVKRIPIMHSDDLVGRQKKKIEWMKDKIDRLELQLQNKKDLESGEEEAMTKEMEELKVQLPKEEQKYREMFRMKSTDIVKVMEHFALMAIGYKHKTEIEDYMLLAQDLVNRAEELKEDPFGNGLISKMGTLISTKGENGELKAMLDYAIDSSLYNRKRAIEGVTQKQVFTSEESRSEAAKIRVKQVEAMAKLKKGTIDRAEYDKIEKEVYDELSRLVGARNVSVASIVDLLNDYTMLKGIGYNPLASFRNLIFGTLNNIIHAAGEEDFTIGDTMKAVGQMKAATAKSLGHGGNKTAQKIRALMVKYNLETDIRDAAYGTVASRDKQLDKFGMAVPFEIFKRSEYFVQGVLLLSMLNHEKIKIDGKDVSLWEAYDENGNLKVKDESMEERIDVKATNRFTTLRAKIRDISSQIHGDYDPNSTKKIKKHVWGRMLMVFRNWIPETIETRFGGKRWNPRLGREVKGRYRTLGELGAVDSLTTLAKMLGKKIGVVKNPYTLLSSETDVANMKKVMAELITVLSLIALYGVLKALAGGDDDDKKKRWFFKLMMNQLSAIENEFKFSVVPASAIKIIKDPLPVLKLYIDAGRLGTASWNTLVKDDKRYDGEYWFRSFSRLFPLLGDIDKMKQTGSKLYNN